MLETSDLHVSYGNIRALKGVSLEVKAREVVTLIGPNGGGKSTLLKAIVGLVEASIGKIKFLGQEIKKETCYQRSNMGIMLVPEGRHVLFSMTVEENLLMGAYGRRDKTEIRRDLEGFVDRFPVLGRRKNLKANVLSGGEQQILAIARALMRRPRLLMLDEPSLGLSPIMVTQVFKIINELRSEGLAILLSEQNARKALQGADYGYILENGLIVLEDDAERLLCSDSNLMQAYLGFRSKTL
jgi:branched-chain amino acid transport system ATP-binding protein